VLFFGVSEKRRVQRVPALIELPIRTRRKTQFLAVPSPGIHPHVKVGVAGVPVEKRNGLPLRKTRREPPVEQAEGLTRSNVLLETQRHPVVRSSRSFGGTTLRLCRFPRPGVRDQAQSKKRIAICSLPGSVPGRAAFADAANLGRHCVKENSRAALRDRTFAADIAKMGGRRSERSHPEPAKRTAAAAAQTRLRVCTPPLFRFRFHLKLLRFLKLIAFIGVLVGL